jgi:ribosomal-protein-alanine N-acetyltransferase
MAVELVGARCVVRPFIADDAVSIAIAADDRRIWLQLRDLFPYPYRLADAEVYIARTRLEEPSRSFAIVIDGRAAGGVALQPMTDINHRSAEIGYWLGAAFWGRGIAAEAVTLVTNWAFQGHGLLRVFAQPFADNVGSKRVLEKAGYQLEGTMRRSAVKDGEVRDQCLYARLSPLSLTQDAM